MIANLVQCFCEGEILPNGDFFHIEFLFMFHEFSALPNFEKKS
jgi:hypothetical protein